MLCYVRNFKASLLPPPAPTGGCCSPLCIIVSYCQMMAMVCTHWCYCFGFVNFTKKRAMDHSYFATIPRQIDKSHFLGRKLLIVCSCKVANMAKWGMGSRCKTSQVPPPILLDMLLLVLHRLCIIVGLKSVGSMTMVLHRK